MDNSSDDFPCRCRALTNHGFQCSKKSNSIVYVSDRESWIEALKTGWPCMVKGMKSPEYRGRGLCHLHIKKWYKRETMNAPFRMVGEEFSNPELNREYEEAIAIGDTKNGGIERKRLADEQSNKSSILSSST